MTTSSNRGQHDVPVRHKANSIRAISVAVVEREGQVLIGRRPDGADLSGLWEFPGGKVQPGETLADAACRECREETGLDVRVVHAYPEVLHNYPHGRLRISFFRCALVDDRAEPRPPFRWVAVNSLGQYQFPTANASLLAMLMQQC